jgi:hypothetical protein
MNKPVLVIMAAGMGSRYGGLKQIDPVDENGHIIMDFSLYDAKLAGFEKVIFIIKRENEADFKKAIGNRISSVMDVSYAFQELDSLPEGYEVPDGRVKPWGTAHAIASCDDLIDAPFAVINADDYYGRDAFKKIYDFLCRENDNKSLGIAMVGYRLANTLTENGHVARGICEVGTNGELIGITERTRIEQRGASPAFTEDDGETWTNVSGDTIVSMNLWGFPKEFMAEIKAGFGKFLDEGLKTNPLKCEYFLPSVVNRLLSEDKATVLVLPSEDKWYGVTYKEDKPVVVDAIKRMKDAGLYPASLWKQELTIKAVIDQFRFTGTCESISPWGNGHINDTFLLVCKTEDGAKKRYILQRMNRSIFKKPVEVMENIMGVTSYLKNIIMEQGGDAERETLNVIPTNDDKAYFVDTDGEYWRAYIFIESATCYEQAKTPQDFYESALSFGNFQRLLADYPAATLHETIPQFHDTRKRIEDFKKAVAEDVCGRAKDVPDEIKFVMDREALSDYFGNLLAKGEIPLRVTHNDTKLNNIMIDDETRKGICVIDLDTVMPGLAMNDFGDSIRFGASTALEDERDLNKVSCDMGLFETYTKGFIEGCGGKLTQKEIELLPMGAKIMTYECGMRFLTDYLQGDTYFKIERPGQNLDRARTQFKLVSDMEEKWDTMTAICKTFC